jgi:hypothetical protein
VLPDSITADPLFLTMTIESGATNRRDREDFPTAIAPWYAPAVIRVLLEKYAAQFRKAVPLFYYGYGCRLQPWLSLVKP